MNSRIAYDTATEAERDYAATFATLSKISWVGHCMYHGGECISCGACEKRCL